VPEPYRSPDCVLVPAKNRPKGWILMNVWMNEWMCLVKQHPFHLSESNQLQILTGLLTGHCHIKWHLFQLGMADNQRCGRLNRWLKWSCMFLVTARNWPPGLAFYETRWLWGHRCQQDGAIHPGCRAAECVSKRAAQTISNIWSVWLIKLPTLLHSVLFVYCSELSDINIWGTNVWNLMWTD